MKGFTIIELLVSLTVIIILSTIILINYRTSGQQFDLDQSSHQLAQNIRKVSEMAMSAKEIQGPTGERIISTGGYGVFFQILPNPPYYEIILFADCNNNQQYTLGNVCGTSPNMFSERIENISLEENVRISNVFPSSPLHITFKPPSPIVSISGGNLARIILSLETDSTKTETISVNKAGLITIE